jgi:hypothetical protein
MRYLIVLMKWFCIVDGEEYTTAIDHIPLIFMDAFNNSYLARQGYKGQYNADSTFPGIPLSDDNTSM